MTAASFELTSFSQKIARSPTEETTRATFLGKATRISGCSVDEGAICVNVMPLPSRTSGMYCSDPTLLSNRSCRIVLTNRRMTFKCIRLGLSSFPLAAIVVLYEGAQLAKPASLPDSA